MRQFLFIFLVLFGVNSQAQLSIGRKVQFHTQDGKPRFGVQMFDSRFSITFSVNGYEISQNKQVYSVTLQMFNKNTGEAAHDPIQLREYPNGVSLAGT